MSSTRMGMLVRVCSSESWNATMGGNSWPALWAVHVVYRGIVDDDGMEAVRRANEGRGEREELLRGERGSMPEWTCTNMQRDDRSGPF